MVSQLVAVMAVMAVALILPLKATLQLDVVPLRLMDRLSATMMAVVASSPLRVVLNLQVLPLELLLHQSVAVTEGALMMRLPVRLSLPELRLQTLLLVAMLDHLATTAAWLAAVPLLSLPELRLALWGMLDCHLTRVFDPANWSIPRRALVSAVGPGGAQAGGSASGDGAAALPGSDGVLVDEQNGGTAARGSGRLRNGCAGGSTQRFSPAQFQREADVRAAKGWRRRCRRYLWSETGSTRLGRLWQR